MSAPVKRGLGERLGRLALAPFRLVGLGKMRDRVRADWEALRAPLDLEDRRVRIDGDRSIDVEASAFLHGMRVAAFEDALAHRRQHTARSAWVYFGLGCVFGAGWLYRLATLNGGALLSALQFAPAAAVFFLLAFKFSLQNYQIRERRIASVRDYLSDGDFWPR